MKINFLKVGFLSRCTIKKVLNCAQKTLKQPTNVELSVSFLSEEEIKSLNNQHRGVDSVTDVLSFPTLALVAGEVIDPKNYPYDIDLATGELYLGDVLICHDVAVKQAQEYGHSVDREMGYLLVHAILHLLGYDHIQDEDKTLMRQQEERILTALGLVREE